MREWKEYKLSSFMDFNPSTPLKKGMESAKVAMEHLTPNGKKIRDWTISNFSGGSKFINGDTLVARITPCLENGKIGYVDFLKDGEVAFGSTEFIVLREKQTISDSQFIFYFAYWSEFRDLAILLMTGSSGRQRVETEVLKNKVFNLPPLPEQKAIADVLSSLDDKIDLLHRQNKTLEGMAEALFRKWFVEEAKEEWEECKLGDILYFNYGKGLNEQQRKGSGYPVIGSNGIVGYHGIVTGRKGTLGQVLLINENFYPIDTTFYITGKNDYFPIHYFYFLLKTLNLGDMNSDSAVPGLNRDAAHGIDIKKVSTEIIQKFEDTVSHFYSKIFANQHQIRTLTQLRDTLLPKLMSGEVRL